MILSNYLPLWTILSVISYISAQCPNIGTGQKRPLPKDYSSIQHFGLKLFHELVPKSPTENFIFSPFSIWNALVLVYVGASGKTEEELTIALGEKNKADTLHKFKSLLFNYNNKASKTLTIANRAYFDTSVSIFRCIENILHNDVMQLSLTQQPRQSSKIINDFVSNVTRGNIKEIVTPRDIERAHMVLINAAYFKDSWKAQFDPNRTSLGKFQTLDKRIVDVQMMSDALAVNYAFNHQDTYEIVELPYSRNNFSLFIVLPYHNNETTFNHVQSLLTPSKINEMISTMQKNDLVVHLPKFDLDYTVTSKLKSAFRNLGIKSALNPTADFTAFSFNPNLKVDDAVHKAFITINEEGTEAGAATSVIMNKIGSSDFKCNRPFIFFIRDNTNNIILFMGVYKSPKDVISSQPSIQPINPIVDENVNSNIPDTSNSFLNSADVPFVSQSNVNNDPFGLNQPSIQDRAFENTGIINSNLYPNNNQNGNSESGITLEETEEEEEEDELRRRLPKIHEPRFKIRPSASRNKFYN